ncbi:MULTISPECIES: Flp family type IVb pilin [Sphingomonas]|jgi:pilus assembly protein Flp/PilA|uniref:Flp family type IVb pilin n=2 Tax=Sphingomonas TaxID=13687 RepID=UPI0010E6C1B1|nr:MULTISPECIES: Flp family type IVb pilin [Sphingomonas]TCQ05015.1 pilus assembly protein Flp/PilA [Sphingomonas sp. PP-CC-3A-396]
MKSDKSMLTIAGRTLRRVLRNSRGATAIEYGLILAFVVIALIVGLTNLADSTIGMWGKVDTKVANAR